MATPTRPFGRYAFGWGPYSKWRFPALDATTLLSRSMSLGTLSDAPVWLVSSALLARSGSFARANLDMPLTALLGGRSGMHAQVRLYWEELPLPDCGDDWDPEEGCDVVWTPAPGCPAAWTPAPGCPADWTPAAGCDAAWATLPRPPLVCTAGRD